jgi:5-(aminomethyl)-3-furanmethanol phosphate kinase
MRRRDGVVVVKVGGSYAGSTDLKTWLEALAGCAGDVVLVPGGGPFADAVRRAQEQMGFDDRAAHHMALTAMEQYGCALLNLGTRMTRAASAAGIRRALRQREIPLWCPSRMVLAADEIPAAWDVTADSLAAWLAGELGAARLLLVKQIRPGGPRVRAADLVAQGLVDARFPDFLRASGACAAVAGPADHAAAAAAIHNGTLCGTQIDLH